MRSFLFLFFLVIQLSTNNDTIAASDTEGHKRVKRIIDVPPTPTTTPRPLTSEEMRELESGTESPHVYDYPEEIYKSKEYRQGEWSKNPIPKKKTMNVTTTVTEEPKKTKKKVQSEKGTTSPMSLDNTLAFFSFGNT